MNAGFSGRGAFHLPSIEGVRNCGDRVPGTLFSGSPQNGPTSLTNRTVSGTVGPALHAGCQGFESLVIQCCEIRREAEARNFARTINSSFRRLMGRRRHFAFAHRWPPSFRWPPIPAYSDTLPDDLPRDPSTRTGRVRPSGRWVLSRWRRGDAEVDESELILLDALLRGVRPALGFDVPDELIDLLFALQDDALALINFIEPLIGCNLSGVQYVKSA